MLIDIEPEMLRKRINNQLLYIAGYDKKISLNIINCALLDIEASLKESNIKQTKTIEGNTIFRTTHIGQYAMFLWHLSRRVCMMGDVFTAEMLSYLNSSVNSIFLNYRVDMPKHFYLDHPLGSIIGRASIGDYFFCAQGCTIGAVQKNGKLLFPKMGGHCEMLSGSSVIGECDVGDYVIFASHCLVKNRNIPSNSIVFGQDRDIDIRTYDHEEILYHMSCF